MVKKSVIKRLITELPLVQRVLFGLYFKTKLFFRYYSRDFDIVHELFEQRAAAKRISPESRVLSGPFKGMVYPDLISAGSALLPKIIGSYESELHTIISSELLSSRYNTLLNIGCGEGYYAVGLALYPQYTKVFAVDTHLVTLRLCRYMASTNKVQRKISFYNTIEACLQNEHFSDRTVVICDCEGCEVEMLDPTKVPAYAKMDILVECHDFLDPSITKTLSERFSPTHHIKKIAHQSKKRYTPPELRTLKAQINPEMLLEHRPEKMSWLWMQVKR
jgi:SAM-dependent methyltransferase